MTDQKPMVADETYMRKLLLAYGRKVPEAVQEVTVMEFERMLSLDEAPETVRSKLFLQLRDWLVRAGLELAAEIPWNREALQRVIVDVLAVQVHEVKLHNCIGTINAILRQNDMARLWDKVATYVDKAYPRIPEDGCELKTLDAALKERYCSALTILPFSEGGNDEHLLNQMSGVVARGRPFVRIRPAYTFKHVYLAVSYVERLRKRSELRGDLEFAIVDYERRAAELKRTLEERGKARQGATKISKGDRVKVVDANHEFNGEYGTTIRETLDKSLGEGRKWAVQFEEHVRRFYAGQLKLVARAGEPVKAPAKRAREDSDPIADRALAAKKCVKSVARGAADGDSVEAMCRTFGRFASQYNETMAMAEQEDDGSD